MEQTSTATQEDVNKVYQYAANLMVHQKKNSVEAAEALVAQGFDSATAETIVSNLEGQISAAKKSRANKDMLYGGLWCVGGTVATLADVGFIFWGAIVFGGIQFFKGAYNYNAL